MSAAPPLSTLTKLTYGVGSMAYGVKDVAFRTFLLYYYNYVIGAPATLVSGAIMVALVLDAISDPIIGQVSDNMRTKWGRRHPLMYISAIPAAASFLLLWHPPSGLTDTQLFIYVALLASGVRTFITLYEIPSSALAPELATDYNDRTSIASYRYFFAYFGGVGLAFIALYFLLQPTPEYPAGLTNPGAYWTFGIVGSVIMITSVIASTAGTHHRIKYLRVPPKPETKSSPLDNLKVMVETFSHKGFLAILGFGLLKYTAIGMTSALTLYFSNIFWRFSPREISILVLESLVASTIALAIAPLCSRTFGKRNSAFILAVLAVVFGIAPYVLRFAGLFWENGSPYLLPTFFAVHSMYYVCGVSSAILVHAMIGDVIDDSSLRTGRRSEALFYSANSFMQKCVSGLGIMVAGALLAIVQMPTGANPADVPREVITHLVFLYIPAIAVLYLGGACFLYFYRISKESHEANLEEVRKRDETPSVDPDKDPSETATANV